MLPTPYFAKKSNASSSSTPNLVCTCGMHTFHSSSDHNSGLPAIMTICPDAEIFCNSKGADAIRRFFPPAETSKWHITNVSHGQTLNLGHQTLTFIETPLAHWCVC